MSPAQHTLFHLPPCPGCLAHKSVLKTEIAPSLTVVEACEQYIKSRSIAGAGLRARYLRKQSLRDLEDYSRPLVRFAAKLRLDQVCWENIAEYQIERSAGLLGPSPEELFPVYLKRTVRALAKVPGKSPRKTKEELQNDPQVIELVRAQLSALPQREIGPNKINQEVGMLIRIMKCAGVWTAELEELYEPLQREESDIPRALSPDEQDFFFASLKAASHSSSSMRL